MISEERAHTGFDAIDTGQMGGSELMSRSSNSLESIKEELEKSDPAGSKYFIYLLLFPAQSGE
jgi:hypothetical protein